MDRMQLTALYPPIDGAAAETEHEQLDPRDHPVLAPGKASDDEIHGGRKYFSIVMNNFLHPAKRAARSRPHARTSLSRR